MHLLIDAGNTRIKWRAVESFGAVGESYAGAFPTSVDKVGDELKLVLAQCSVERFRSVALSNVAGVEIRDAVESWCQEHADAPLFVAEVESISGLVKPAYKVLANLGVDRWLAMLSAYEQRDGSCCVLSVGTAVTADFISSDGEHMGGVIAPGVALMMSSLFDNTRQVKPVSLKVPQIWELGCDTLPCVENGVAAMLQGFAAQIAQEGHDLGIKTVFVAGGDAMKILSWLESAGMRCVHDDLLVIKGLQALVVYKQKGLEAKVKV
ncbi:type III pantothenate kinase [Teredinibacter sp. KSP-S5-2]|uniref:type III pantothenate kinase n=1 Tax=Teredinibacter sp. KSP-S5-2 TaxID=3034506 RepID=UPI002934E96C|nr:type III pantothenate kinase [Teredinibacter sp. KSP-S5-2]WNO09687.1 type III pantothenate kinase [Teredinibacter sp. KSP-S5-2]